MTDFSKWKELRIHEICADIRAMTDEEMSRLEDSIRESKKLRQKILTYNGMIIDGRCRWIAARNVGLELTPDDFEEWDGEGTIWQAVFDLNVARRQLTTAEAAELVIEAAKGREAEIAAEKSRRCSEAGKFGGRGKKGGRPGAETLSESERKGVTQELAGKAGVGMRTVERVRRIREEAPELMDAVHSGEMSIKRADEKVAASKPRKDRKHAGLPPGRHHVPLIDKPDAAGPTKEVYIPDPDKVTRLEDVVADHEEREAIRDQDSDEAWVEQLPLYSQLHGKVRDAFVYDAIAARHLQQARKAWAAAVAGELKGNRRLPPYLYAQRRALECGPPEYWTACPAVDEGGCGGEGTVPFVGECPQCFGAGYRVRQ